jgi:riboflavin kinase/FMN adenylyltransferase
LGYHYFFSGEVIRGDGRGEKLGFPTANLRVAAEKQLPPHGIYGAWAEVDGQRYPALLHLGPRPTLGEETVSVEAHLLDFPSRKLYGEKLTVTPDIALRQVESFPNLDAMVHQMEVDRKQFLTYIERKEKTSAS